MVKRELAKLLQENTKLNREGAVDAVNMIIDAFKEEVKAGNQIALQGFGTFKVVETKAKKGRNPKTGEKIDIPAGRRVKFKASKGLLD